MQSKDTARWLAKVWGVVELLCSPRLLPVPVPLCSTSQAAWLTVLRRRQKDRFEWSSIGLAERWPKVEIRHPWPEQRLAVSALPGATQGRSRMP